MQETGFDHWVKKKGMDAHSSILFWRIPWTEEPGGLQSLESQRVRHDWVTNTLYNELNKDLSRQKQKNFLKDK